MSSALVAVIRRLPGGGFAKAPRAATMPAMPVHASKDLTATYIYQWPKHQAEFLLYGTRRSMTGTRLLQMPLSTQVRTMAQVCDGTNGFAHTAGNAAGLKALFGQGCAVQSADDQEGAGLSGLYGGGESPPAATPTPKDLGLAGMKKRYSLGQKLSMITAYDYPSARFARNASVELVLVGDSIGNCRLGLASTVGVTMEDMCRAVSAVRRGVDATPVGGSSKVSPKPLVVGDMPFGSYLVEVDALRNAAAVRMAGADLVKLAGGAALAPHVRTLTATGIAVMAHVGLDPQHALSQGGLKLQGTTAESALKLQGTTAESALGIVRDTKALVAAGAVAVVVEYMPVEVGRAVQAAAGSVPVIGIGAGGDVAGQVLVCDDLLGLHGIRSGAFPAPPHSRRMKPDELSKLCKALPQEGVNLKPDELSKLRVNFPERVPKDAHDSTYAPVTLAPPTPPLSMSSFAFRKSQRVNLAMDQASRHASSQGQNGNIATLQCFKDLKRPML